MADSWEAASKSASKILGDKGKIPKYSAAVPKAAAAEGKAFDDFKKSREDLKSKLLALQNADEAHKNAISQFQDTIDVRMAPGADRRRRRKRQEPKGARQASDEPVELQAVSAPSLGSVTPGV